MQIVILLTLGLLVGDAFRREDGPAILISSILFVGFGLLLMWLGGLL